MIYYKYLYVCVCIYVHTVFVYSSISVVPWAQNLFQVVGSRWVDEIVERPGSMVHRNGCYRWNLPSSSAHAGRWKRAQWLWKALLAGDGRSHCFRAKPVLTCLCVSVGQPKKQGVAAFFSKRWWMCCLLDGNFTIFFTLLAKPEPAVVPQVGRFNPSIRSRGQWHPFHSSVWQLPYISFNMFIVQICYCRSILTIAVGWQTIFVRSGSCLILHSESTTNCCSNCSSLGVGVAEIVRVGTWDHQHPRQTFTVGWAHGRLRFWSIPSSGFQFSNVFFSGWVRMESLHLLRLRPAEDQPATLFAP